MEKRIEQLRQDLASAGYAKGTQAEYLKTASRLAVRFGVEIDAISREQVREFVDELGRREGGPWVKRRELCALRFLYRKTIGTPEMVSFIALPKTHSPLPTVLSLAEVEAWLTDSGASKIDRLDLNSNPVSFVEYAADTVAATLSSRPVGTVADPAGNGWTSYFGAPSIITQLPP